jgi:8-oxo-dGTP pyrophosphatase MutT (NUDIX family)
MLHLPLRSAYRAAHAVLRTYWRVRRPETRGALLALWCGGKILVVQTTYRSAVSLPGGYVKPGESPATAVLRELREELGVSAEEARLRHAYHATKDFEHREDTLDIFALELDERPLVRPNRYELEWARWKDPEEVLAMPEVVPHLREYLEREVARRRG